MSERLMIAGAVFLAACGGGTAATSSSTSATVTETSTSTLSFADALGRAEAAYPGTAAFEVEYEEHEGRRVVEVEVLSGDSVREVYYDLTSGDVVHEASETPEADEAAALPVLRAGIDAGSLSMRRALEIATANYAEASIDAVELQVENGVAIVSIVVREASGTTRYVHDPATGSRVSSAPGSAEHSE